VHVSALVAIAVVQKTLLW